MAFRTVGAIETGAILHIEVPADSAPVPNRSATAGVESGSADHPGGRRRDADAAQRPGRIRPGAAGRGRWTACPEVASQIVSQLAACGLPGAEHPVTISYTDYSRAKGQPLLNSVNIVVDLALGGR